MIRSLSIVSGLIIFLFVTTHLLNLSLGIFSIELLEQSRPYFFAIWGILPFELALILSFIIHTSLGLRALYLRNTLRMSSQDRVQLISSLLIIPLLIPHIIAIKMGENLLGLEPNFIDFLTIMWIDLPLEGLRQVLLLMVVWVHGCIGLITWLRLKSWWAGAAPFMYPLAVAIPTFALLGFVEAGRDAVDRYNAVQAQGQYSSYNYSVNESATYPKTLQADSTGQSATAKVELSAEQMGERVAQIESVVRSAFIGYFALLLLVMLARYIRLRKNRDWVEIHYADGVVIKSKIGPTLLELSISNDVPHANLCHGKGRCGTCRVRIIKSDSTLSPAADLELAMLKRLNSTADTRLACQVEPGAGVIHLERLLKADVLPQDLHSSAQEKDKSATQSHSEAST
ncbi:MAG: 2Fe-2S iron-sulfur cluster binding domain-containing protein [Oceanospirillaceae bacterium]|nr:2Fe-2S iron-sulfur cluster binding domain-containing protein [Oceanospirillaceae bacterium]